MKQKLIKNVTHDETFNLTREDCNCYRNYYKKHSYDRFNKKYVLCDLSGRAVKQVNANTIVYIY